MFWHECLKLLLAVYVDGFKLAGPKENHDEGWKLIGEHIDMDPPEDVGRYLGCEHIVQHQVKLPVERRPFAHVFDDSIQDPSHVPAASVARTEDSWTHFPEHGTFVHHHVNSIESVLMFGRVTLWGLNREYFRCTDAVPCTSGDGARDPAGCTRNSGMT